MTKENEETKRLRLVQQAKNMRARQVEKRTTGHKCHPSETDRQLLKLEECLTRVAPANIAPIPIAMMFEDGRWTVDVSVRIKSVTDYEVSGTSESLANALVNARRTLSHQTDNERQSYQDAKTYGLSY